MAICNTFGELKTTGTFYTFSQYMEDLTAWQTEGKYHKIIPSKFIAVHIRDLGDLGDGLLPKYIQDGFENACACFKNSNMEALVWSPEYSKTLFWNMMFGTSKFIDNEVDPMGVYNTSIIDISDIKYIGDINLQSYNVVDGMGYSEIYCHIPDEAKASQYTFNQTPINPPLIIEKKSGDYLEGFTEDNTNDDSKKLNHDYTYTIDKTSITIGEEKKLDEVKSFDINTIIVLYNIENEGDVICRDIPMGIYFTGNINTETHTITNAITKYVSNEEVFGSGTSYGLRICSRFVVASEMDGYNTQVVTCEDNNYGDLTRVLSQMSISQQKMDQIVNKSYYNNQNYKDLLSIFKNQRTNVPYIKYINGEKFWFVNGKIIDSAESQLISLPNQPQMYIIAKAANADGEYIFEKNSDPQTINIQAKAYENGIEISNTYFQGLGQFEVEETTEYEVEASYNGRTAYAKTKVYFVDPTYVGCIETDSISEDSEDLKDIVKNLSKSLQTSKNQTHKFTTNGLQYLVIAYPSVYGEVSAITDANDYDLKADFTKYDLEINNVDYYVYISNNKTSVINYSIQIK